MDVPAIKLKNSATSLSFRYLGSFLAQVFLFITYYDALNMFDGGVRSAYGTNTSTGGIFATYPPDHVTVFTAFFDQVFFTAMLL